ncbi:MAG: selenium-dependent xanthine dehydrogenase [Proteobacteria bacterium]|nr:selenium-dependent xanthine dehydrogenase [Pseudomonadota bacterium]
MEFNLNGSPRNYDGDPKMSLLRYLRDIENIVTPKDGCAPEGACGCCTVEMNSKGVLSCLTPMRKVEGKSVITTDGLDPLRRDVFTEAFIKNGGVQCGYCTPGIVMAGSALLRKNPEPNRDEIKKALNPNLCRCTGYKKIVDSILSAADALQHNTKIPRKECDGKLGSSLRKYQSEKLVLGERPFVNDMRIEGMVFGALKFSDHPRAKVLSLDLSEAKKHPGVIEVFDASDVPGEIKTGLIRNDWPLMIKVGEETRYIGDVLAGVVADSEQTAREAMEKIVVDYEVLVPLTDPKAALAKDAYPIHEGGNLLSDSIVKRGDLENAIKNSAFVSKGIYNSQLVEHAFMETECCIAQPWGKGVELFSQGQGIYEDKRQVATLLDLKEKDVKVSLIPNGGGFGGKEDLSVQGHTALFAFILQKPVKVRLNRGESLRMHPKRHPMEMDYELGCDKNGKFTYLKARIIGDTGAYASVGMKVLERSAGHASGAYNIPVTDIKAKAVFTNNIPCGAMRGFGVNQVMFAIDSCVDDLCEQGGFDRWQIRWDNALIDGSRTATGQLLEGGVGVRASLEAIKDSFYSSKFGGIGCGIKNTGLGNGAPDEGNVKITITDSGDLVIHHGWTEMGQGINTMAIQFLCELTGIDPNRVGVTIETTSEVKTGMTTASRGTSLLGHAIIDAVKTLNKDLESHKLEELAGKVYEGTWICDWTTPIDVKGKEVISHYSYAYAAQVVDLDEKGSVSKIYAAHDAGVIINPTLFEGQIEGSIHMGLGYALTEELQMEGGFLKSPKLRKCGILRAKQTPEIIVTGVEVSDPHGPLGAKGVGEIGLTPTAGAVANAYFRFDGVRRYKLPMGVIKK